MEDGVLVIGASVRYMPYRTSHSTRVASYAMSVPGSAEHLCMTARVAGSRDRFPNALPTVCSAT
eukprot:910730-Rhodomonas_salina.1